jgi:Putative neutral zinc metallopeptidase
MQARAPKRRRTSCARLAGLAAAGGLAAALAGCGSSAHHHSTSSTRSTLSARAEQASVAPGARGLPTGAKQLFASDGSAPGGHDDTVTPGGSVVASSGFNPARDGFSFQNYGFIAGEELTPTVLQQMFGTTVCAHGSGGSCQLYPAVQQWAALVSQTGFGGHCYGFSMLALRFFTHNLSPSDYGASTTYGLQFTPAIESEIAANYVEQYTAAPTAAASAEEPSQIVQALTAALKSRSGPYYTLALFSGPPGTQGREGHAITPLGISNLGNGKYQILVYDNNYPGVTRGLDVDVNTQTWSYVAETNPQSGQAVTWSGQGTSNELTLIPVSAVEGQQNFTAATQADDGVDTIALGGDPDRHANLLISTGDGRKLGFVGGRLVNQIKGARVIYPIVNQVALAHPEPVYLVPGNPKLTVTVAGGDPTGAAAKVFVAGPGFGTTVSNLAPSSSSQASIHVAPSGSNVSVTLTGPGTGQAPTVQLARDASQGGSTVTVAPRSLSSGNTLTVGLAAGAHTVSLASSQITAPVAVKLSSVTAQGTSTVNRSHVAVGKGAPRRTKLGQLLLGASIPGQLPGVAGRKGTPASLRRFTKRPPLGPSASISGIQNMSLSQEQGAMLQNVAQFWQAWFGDNKLQLPAAGYSLVTGRSACGTAQISASSAPLYCPSNAVIYLPQTTVARSIKPLGDSALLYVLAYLYAEHVGDALGVTANKYGVTKIPQIYSCFAGVYFQQAEGEGVLQPTDQAGVNKVLAALAPARSKVTSTQLTEAFNRGILSNFHPAVCLQ